MSTDEHYMRRCLQLAANGLGRTRPNPLVGCVIVDSRRDVPQCTPEIVSEGFHQQYGHNHAERNALLRKTDRVHTGVCPYEGATLYVNLEPCSHYGKTPPCADLIIEKGIRRVVCCNDDPNPLVAGNGFRKLEAAGIEVVRHVLEEEGRELNRRFFTFMEQRRPYVILKWAESADGFMAPATAGLYWLSTQRQNRLNHRWRTEEAAILVGSETYLQDHPSLTPRHYLGTAPQPVVLDRRGRLNDVPAHWLHLHCQTVEETLQALYERKLQSVIVEGGRQILDTFIASGLYDEVRILRSPQTLGTGLPAPEIPPIAPNRLIIVEP
ncbi:MAG: bifunctional diaminohydroxyphosphoribosylaminopyrimidine deaminase/5-amino-6-(5-phosphoribosylamino)uracil reductase RibD [Bacteroidales bacterium]|nr:bifunctional diaminohydroxyphosphoribosylaminopyrimidine deaminase/5-amino-6-(5-phosphoribosylamino)uracil reductase RibD [Bacteroidales bacterium]